MCTKYKLLECAQTEEHDNPLTTERVQTGAAQPQREGMERQPYVGGETLGAVHCRAVTCEELGVRECEKRF